MISSNPYKPLHCDKPPLRSHAEPFCRRLSPTKSFGPLRGGFLYIPREFAAGPPACNSSYPHLENSISRLDLDTAPRPRTKCGRAGQRRCNTGAGTQIRCKRRPTQAGDTSICVPLARFRGNPFLPAYAGQKFLPPNIPLGTKFSPRTAHSLRSYTLRV